MSDGEGAAPGAQDPGLETLLEFLKGSRGFDFTAYKRTTLSRRVAKRMEAAGLSSYAEYMDFLQVHPEEFPELFNTILINVTNFFRDEGPWAYLDEHVVPRLVEAAAEREVRVWSAGCASGQEAYSVAMLLVRAMGEERFRERVKIYATDMDEDALNDARHASYPAKEVEPIPEELLERCFVPTGAGYTFNPDLRRGVIFGRNDLVQDAPISRIDLLLCRNTLMYFNAESQSRILGRFHFALRPSGFLFLGKSEMLLTHADLFTPLELKCRIFTKVPGAVPRGRVALPLPDPPDPAFPAEEPRVHLRDGAFDVTPIAQVVVDRQGGVSMANARARALFGLSAQDVGRPLQDLEVSYRPVELRAAIERAYAERRPVAVGPTRWRPPAGDVPLTLEIEVAPLISDTGAQLGVSILFHDVTAQAEMREELERSKRELETAYEELQSTVEELETTNEELQSTNEELETTNEELQSTNEELETMNEELQSTNEELETINDELRDRTTELHEVNAFLEQVLTSLGIGVAVVDGQGVVQMWNTRADDLWGLRPDEAFGQHLLSLDIGLPVGELRTPLRQAIAGESPEPLTLEAINRRGQPVTTRVTVRPVSSRGDDRTGGIVLMEELWPGDGADAQR